MALCSADVVLALCVSGDYVKSSCNLACKCIETADVALRFPNGLLCSADVAFCAVAVALCTVAMALCAVAVLLCSADAKLCSADVIFCSADVVL